MKLYRLCPGSAAAIFLMIFFGVLTNCYSQNHPINLKCEYLENPIGVDSYHPRFTWNLADTGKGTIQTAYSITVATDSLMQEKVWQLPASVSNGSACLVTYKGEELKPFTKYYWKVTSVDKAGKNSVAGISSFETGMMDMKNWKGSWI